MKSLSTFLSIAALLSLIAVVVPLNRMRGHWLMLVFLAAQLAFVLLAFMALQKIERNVPAYQKLFAVAALLSIAASWILAFDWMAELPSFSIELGAITSLACSFGAVLFLLTSVENPAARFYTLLGGAFLFPGLLTLLAVVNEISAADTMARSALAAFWILNGLYLFAAAASLKNANLSVLPRTAWIPSVIAVVCFGLLALGLSRAQMETNRAALHVDAAEEAR